ncbi:cell cycle progression protein 1 isoform X2 [Sphaerodactylus townsendi]|uniref:cell cycle progression protein 1 isoform X2 n=1 Tax=Sphaerodactylus townsendi TaxID=933632 RepID=UPI00202758E6|nr:cell cycle progression protein 1 isoform X2 [Sphaerodactylus townsendi]
MSENSSDSDSSSCGWTVIHHEGSDVEGLASENEGPSGPTEPGSEEPVTLLPEEQQGEPAAVQAEFGQNNNASSAVDPSGSSSLEIPPPAAGGEREKLPEEGSCMGAVSDDSDIVTLETPKIEEIGSPGDVSLGEEEEEEEEEIPISGDFHMGCSSSSQYTFCQPEAAFPPHPSGEESSSDETSNGSGPTLRRRRAKKRPASGSESEDAPPLEQDTELAQEQPRKQPFGRGLNQCVILALVIAVSMGFGHFYGLLDGTIQIQKRQLMVEKTHEDELNDVKGHLLQCQQGLGGECQSLKEGLATCLLSTEKEKESFESQTWSLASENQHLRASLEREEEALAVLQEELRKLREQIRRLENLRGAGPDDPVAMENQKLKAHLQEETHRRQSFVQQKKALFTEAQMLRRELDKERQLTEALREELEKLSSQQASPAAAAAAGPRGGPHRESEDIDALRGRLEELEKKLSFEQQRSDLWEKLYVEVKDDAEKREQAEKPVKTDGKGAAAGKGRKKAKAGFFGSVKETFDAMKNSTKEFVRHHKEKIKQAKEAVKENLRKFSDSVKSTFRHFKDSTKNVFEERDKRRHEGQRSKAGKKGKADPHQPYRAPGSQRESQEGRGARESRGPREAAFSAHSQKPRPILKGCSGIFDCAHQEFAGLFNRVLDPIRADEFNQLMHKYLQQEVENFHHWRELDGFLSQFFHNGVFIHDQMLFTDFISDIKDYLEDMEEYQRGREGVFEDVDTFIYAYYFRQDHPPQQGPSQPWKRAPFTQQERPSPKHPQRHRREREGKWHRQGRTNGRHVANVEIEWGQLPLDPKY